jgi:hypothetical protein
MKLRKRNSLLESYSNNELEYRILKFYFYGKASQNDYKNVFNITTIPNKNGVIKVDSKANLMDAFERLNTKGFIKSKSITNHPHAYINEFMRWAITADGRKIIKGVKSARFYLIKSNWVQLKKNKSFTQIAVGVILALLSFIGAYLFNHYHILKSTVD